MKELSKRQQQIIQTSFDLISEKGIQGLTIKNLSKEIGISEPAIYRHFKDKLTILQTMIEAFHFENKTLFSSLFQMQNNPSFNISAIEKLNKLFEHKFSVFEKNRSMAAVIFSEEIFQNEESLKLAISEIMNELTSTIQNIILNGQKNNEIRNDVDAESIALVLIASLRLIIKKWYLSNYSFCLKDEGIKYSKDLLVLIQPYNNKKIK